MNVTIVGAGYVGLTTAVALAHLGHRVIGLEVHEGKLAQLRARESPIFEPGLDALLRSVDQLSFTNDAAEALEHADVVFIAVGTPTGQDGRPDLRQVKAAAAMIGTHIRRPFTVVVNKSTVPIGSGNWVDALVGDAVKASSDSAGERSFSVCSNPEFLREGQALHDSFYPDRIVVGGDDRRAIEILHELYRPIVEQSFAAPDGLPRPEGLGAIPFVTTSLASAEFVKYAANAFLALKISFINELAELSERVGADITQVSKGIGLDQRIGTRFLQAGLGWGGSCFGKYTAALVTTAREYGLKLSIVQAARDVNARQRDRMIEKLLHELKLLTGKTIGILGLAFKPDTDDLRDAPAIEVARRLVERGARVRVHDPVAMPRARAEHADLDAHFCEHPEEVAVNADAILLVTEWNVYQSLRWDRIAGSMRNRVIIDGRNALDRDRVERAGMRYIGIGR
jgi:UDPglucose 6-dehydrogenase